jgi:hypothetical protein
MPRGNWRDDPSIPDDAPLWRGILPDQIDYDPNTGKAVPSTGALYTQEVSVSIGSETTPQAVIAKGAARGVQWRLWEFTAGAARRAGCIVDRDREPDDPAHAVVLSADDPGNKRVKQSAAKKLIKHGRWQDEAAQ